jgi:hypothetical protein
MRRPQVSAAPGRQGQPPPLHAEGDPRAAGGDRRHAAQLRRIPTREGRAARPAVRLRQGCRAHHRRLRHRLLRGMVASTGSSSWRACRSRSTSPASSATAIRRSEGRRWRSSSRSRARRRHAGGAALRQGEKGQRIALDRQRAESSIARESDVVLPTLAGPEIGVASTKAFTTQLTVLACLAIARARRAATARSTPSARARCARCRGARRRAEVLKHDGRSRRSRARSSRRATCSISAAAPSYPDRAGGRAEAQGDLLHPRRGLRRRRDEARADRADRREWCRSSSWRRATAVREDASNMQEVSARGGKSS